MKRHILKYPFFQKLLKKYAKGNTTEAENLLVNAWYDRFDQKPNRGVPGLSNPLEAEVTRVRILNRAKGVMARPAWYLSPLIRIAAVLSLVLGVSLGYYQYRLKSDQHSAANFSNVYQTGAAQIKKIVLRDSTIVWLNANSSIHLSEDFGQKQRRLVLNGEANFKVSRDETKPFIVEAAELSVQVLGTSFDIKSYPQLEDINVSVSHGKVQVKQGVLTLANLTIGKELNFNKQHKQFKVKDVRSAQNTSWISGVTVLEKAGFRELQQAMQNVYGLNINTENRELLATSYNITLPANISKKQALELLMGIMEKQYIQKEGNEVVIF